jgi:hypothetical protein
MKFDDAVVLFHDLPIARKKDLLCDFLYSLSMYQRALASEGPHSLNKLVGTSEITHHTLERVRTYGQNLIPSQNDRDFLVSIIKTARFFDVAEHVETFLINAIKEWSEQG